MLPYSKSGRYLISEIKLFEALEDSYVKCSIEDALEYLNSLTFIGLDTETMGLDPYTKPILLLQLGNFDKQFAIDATTINLAPFKELLERKDKVYIMHNAKFDVKVLLHQGIVIKRVYDTMLAEKLLWLGFPAGMHAMDLASCCKNYLNIELDKSVRGKIIDNGLTEEVVVYGCNDVKYLELLARKQLHDLKERGLLKAIEAENTFVLVLAYIEYCGIKLDQIKWREKMVNDQKKLEEARNTLNKWVVDYGNKKYINEGLVGGLFEEFKVPSCKINWASSRQVIPLFEELGFNLWTKDKKTGKMKKSVEGPIIERQESISTIAKPYLEYKKYEKVCSTYGQSWLDQVNPVTHRIHTKFNQLMDTTRLSCGGKDRGSKVEYVNLQNLPADDTRLCFIAEEGNLLIDCDYTAQEDLVFTELSREPKLIEFYNDPAQRDGHSYVAKLCFPEELKDIPESEVKKKRPDLRKTAKGGKFCLHYGGAPEKAAQSLNIPLSTAEYFFNKYLSVFSGIKNYFSKAFKAAWDNGYVLISRVTGHKAYIYDWPTLKGIERRLDSEFWDNYRLYKGQKIQPGLLPEELRWIADRFGEGWSVEQIIDKFTLIEYPDNEKKQAEVNKKRDGVVLYNQNFRLDERTIYLHVVSYFFKRKSSSQRMAYNYSTQGTASQITKRAGVLYWRHLVEKGLLFTVKIVNDVHDEYLVEAPKEIVEEEAKTLSYCMEKAASEFLTVVKLKAVPEIATYWKH